MSSCFFTGCKGIMLQEIDLGGDKAKVGFITRQVSSEQVKWHRHASLTSCRLFQSLVTRGSTN